TVTDANVMLGRLNNETLLGGRMPIKADLAVAGIEKLASELGVTANDAAVGILRVASATMVKAIRSISVERGHNPSDFTLFVYGGAGALFAADVARQLGMSRVVVPPDPGILCAEGAMNATLSTDFVTTILTPLDERGLAKIRDAASALEIRAADWFTAEEVPAHQERRIWTIGARYVGQNYELVLPIDLSKGDARLFANLEAAFHEAHDFTYGFASKSEVIQIVNLAIKAIGELDRPELPTATKAEGTPPMGSRQVHFGSDGSVKTPIFARDTLVSDQQLVGPVIVEQMDTTVIVYPKDRARVDRWGNLVIDVRGL
ncbi:MAG: hydantoinase/oxoprolinase family protein, partial [Geminicoccaceae bacterium]